MSSFVQLALIWFFCVVNKATRATDVQHVPRQLDPISGGDVLRRNIDFPASTVLRSLMIANMLDGIEGSHFLKALDNTITARNPEDSGMINEEIFNLLKDYRGGDAAAALEHMTDGALMKALDNIEGTDLLIALYKALKDSRISSQKRTLDTLSGVAFGESKRRMGHSSSLAKRNFDEIDNVGFNGWQKRWGGRYNTLALARRAFGGPYRMGSVSSLAKKNFDEIDRTGFEGFSKRNAKRSV